MGGHEHDADGSVGRPDGGTIHSEHRESGSEQAASRDAVRRGHATAHEQPGIERHELPGTVPVGAYHVYSHDGRWDPADAPLQGERDVDWLASDEWLAFDVDVRESGPYDLSARVAAADNFGGGHFGIVVDDDPRTRVRFDATGGWYAWDDVETRVHLPRGLHTIRLVVFEGGWKLHQLEFR